MNDQGPIACDLSKIPPEMARRLEAELIALFSEVREVRVIEGGLALRFAPQAEPGLLSRLGATLDYDRLCCPFLGHAIVDEPWGGAVWLHLTGSAAAQAFLRNEIARLVPAAIAAGI